jgi:putative flippase GtrA
MRLTVQFLRFAIIGAAGFLVDVGVLYLLRRSGLDLYSAEWSLYLGAMTFGGLVNYGVYALLITLLALFRDNPWLAVAGGTGAGMLINFLFARRILYRPAPPP